jgi:hypothetical protein
MAGSWGHHSRQLNAHYPVRVPTIAVNLRLSYGDSHAFRMANFFPHICLAFYFFRSHRETTISAPVALFFACQK